LVVAYSHTELERVGVDVRPYVRTAHRALRGTVRGSERVKFLYIANAAVQTTAGPVASQMGRVAFGSVG